MAKKNQISDLDIALNKASQMGMSYAEYQQSETLSSIDFRKNYKKFKKNAKKKAKKNGRSKMD